MFSPQFTLNVKQNTTQLGFGLAFRAVNLSAALLLLISAFLTWPPFWLALGLGILAIMGAGYTERWTFGKASAIYQSGWGPFLKVTTWEVEEITGLEMAIPAGDKVRGAPAFFYRLVMETNKESIVLEVLRGDRNQEKLTAWGKQIAGVLGKKFVLRA